MLAATDADLELAQEQGRLRAALYHRLAGARIVLTPLRQRREDIAAQLRHFVREQLQALGRLDKLESGWLSPAVQRAFVFHDWPGNTRQLARVVEAMVIEELGREQARVPVSLCESSESREASWTGEANWPGTQPTQPVASIHAAPADPQRVLLERALAANDYKLTPTAKAWVSRSTPSSSQWSITGYAARRSCRASTSRLHERAPEGLCLRSLASFASLPTACGCAWASWGSSSTEESGPMDASEHNAIEARTAGRVGRFLVLRELGRGGMGVVFLGYDEQLDRKVAIKLLRARDPGDASHLRLQREAQGLAKLSHPNVVQIYETGSTPARCSW